MTDIKEAQGLEVVAWQDAENPLYTTGEKRQMHGWATDGYPIVELVRLSDATAVIDQLRDMLAGEVETNVSLRNHAHALEERVAELERLAEAISNDCNTVANERNDLRAALKEQEPVATKRQYYYKVNGCPANSATDENCICWHDEGAGPIVPLDTVLCGWREVPVTKAVVMPERRKMYGIISLVDAETYGWNACLDKFESLNGGKP